MADIINTFKSRHVLLRAGILSIPASIVLVVIGYSCNYWYTLTLPEVIDIRLGLWEVCGKAIGDWKCYDYDTDDGQSYKVNTLDAARVLGALGFSLFFIGFWAAVFSLSKCNKAIALTSAILVFVGAVCGISGGAAWMKQVSDSFKNIDYSVSWASCLYLIGFIIEIINSVLMFVGISKSNWETDSVRVPLLSH